MGIPIDGGRCAADFLEDPVKGLLTLETALQSNIYYGKIGIFQQLPGMIDPKRVDIFVEAHMQYLRKNPGQVESADTQLVGDGL